MENASVQDRPKHYPVTYAIGEYTFSSAARIADVRFDDRYILIEFVDKSILSVARQKFQISPERAMHIWDPEVCEIHEILHIADSLQPGSGNKR